MHVGGGRKDWAHRVSYRLFNGPIPKQTHIDHLCNVRACVNPEHLEVVTVTENHRRKSVRDGTASNQFKDVTHCSKGHTLDESNTYVTKEGERVCRTCRQANDRRRRLREKNAVAPMANRADRSG